jgi:antitoxin (DNA-binding transcriptional repressor) of toxin-antitoxin stability system
MMSKIVEVGQSQPTLRELLSLVAAGTEIVLTKNGTPIASFVPIAPSSAVSRVPGLHPGAIWASEDFNEPLPEEFWAGRA